MKINLVATFTLLIGFSLFGASNTKPIDRSPACGAVHGNQGKNRIRISVTGAVSYPGIYFLESSEADLESLVEQAKPKGMICPNSGSFHAPWLRAIAIYRSFPDEQVSTKKLEVDYKKIKDDEIHFPLENGDMIYVGYTMGI